MKNPRDFEQVDMPEAPPPYAPPPAPAYNHATVGHPPTHPGGGYQETVFVVETVDPMAAIFGDHERFVLHQTQSMGCARQPIMMQITDENGQTIMSTVMDPGTTVGSNQHVTVRTQATINFLDARGRIVMTATETATSLTVTSGNRILGVVDGCIGLFGTIVPKNLTGLPICNVIKDESCHKFIGGDGSELGRAGYLYNPEIFEVQLASGLDVNSKSILLATAYAVFMLFYARTMFGKVGARRAGCCMCSIFLFAPLIIFSIILAIVFSTVL